MTKKNQKLKILSNPSLNNTGIKQILKSITKNGIKNLVNFVLDISSRTAESESSISKHESYY